jgi:hypothetical protein
MVIVKMGYNPNDYGRINRLWLLGVGEGNDD